MARVSYHTKSKSKPKTPTAATYGALNQAYAFFNAELFNNELPDCLITLQRHRGAYGYFAGERFSNKDGSVLLDEIALNPQHFAECTVKKTLSTLVHEQAHLWQKHFGKPGRKGYHNKEWVAKMMELGLHPSSTGEPGGKETGQRVSHYIIKGGAYSAAFANFAKSHNVELYADIWGVAAGKGKTSESKKRFQCPECEQKAWAKPTASLMCGECEVPMETAS